MAPQRLGRPQISRRDRAELRRRSRGQAIEARQVRRASIVLLCWRRVAHEEIARRLSTSPDQVRKWLRRFLELGLSGLADRPRAGRPKRIRTRQRAAVVGLACRAPSSFGYERILWSQRLLAQELVTSGRVEAISPSSVGRILRESELRPHKVRMWCTSTDPLFDEKLADITRLYVDPPAGEAVVCVDEKTGMQALSRAHGLRRPRAGEIGKEEFEYRRNGTRCLFACFDVRTGRVLGRVTATRKTVDFIAFMDEVARAYPRGIVHVVLDNLNTHRGPEARAWIARHGNRFRFHFTPTHGSWLNQVEIYFGVLSRRILHHASYSSVQLLEAAVLRFLAQWNEDEAHPFQWTYRGKRRVA